tara:strand:- start:10972 stop:11277 length:306 start_codon:yes stop_codon:yes gene_type:complete
MTNQKLLDKLHKLIENTDHADKKHLKKLRKVLRKLKEKQHELAEQLDQCPVEKDRVKIQQDIDVLTLQRKKGVAVYKTLKAERKNRTGDNNQDTDIPSAEK